MWREGYDSAGNLQFQFLVPENRRLDVIRNAHDSPFSGHLGRDKTTDMILNRFYWPNMREMINNYLQDCTTCAQIKAPHRYNKTELQAIEAHRPFEIVTMDIAGPFPHTLHRNEYVLVMCDHFTKWIELYPMPNQLAKTVADRIVSFICRHGIPEQILSDQGTDFQSVLISELFELLDIHRLRTSPFHPQTDGLSERTIRTVKQMIKAFIIDHPEQHKKWDKQLEKVQLAYNSAVHSTTHVSPFCANRGFQPRIPADLMTTTIKLNLNLTADDYADNEEDADANTYEAADAYAYEIQKVRR